MAETLRMLKFLIAKTLKKARLASVRHSKVHKTSKIESGSSFVSSFMDRYSFCGYDCDIYHAHIGSFTSIASNVVIGGAHHPMEWVAMSPVFYAGRDSVKKKFSENILEPIKNTIIGNDVWIGRSAIIVSGVNVGNGAVIGAGSVVTKDVPSYAIVAGNPAKLIRYRFESKLIQELENVRWWHFPDTVLHECSKYIKDPCKFIDYIQQQKDVKASQSLLD